MASAQSLESDKFSNVSKDFSYSNILIWFSLFCWAVTCFRYNITSSFKFWLHDFQLSESKSSLTVNFSLHVVWSVVLCSLTYVVFVVVFITCFSWSRVRYLKFNYPLVEYIILLVPHSSEKTYRYYQQQRHIVPLLWKKNLLTYEAIRKSLIPRIFFICHPSADLFWNFFSDLRVQDPSVKTELVYGSVNLSGICHPVGPGGGNLSEHLCRGWGICQFFLKLLTLFLFQYVMKKYACLDS